MKPALSWKTRVVAVKDDICGEFGRRAAQLVHPKWIMLSGGAKENHLDVHPYGCDGYLSAFITFKPELAHRYWKEITAGRMADAARIIEQHERPFFDCISSLPGGFDAGIHGTLELHGICKRWRRPPFHSLSDAEMERLADALRKIQLL